MVLSQVPFLELSIKSHTHTMSHFKQVPSPIQTHTHTQLLASVSLLKSLKTAPLSLRSLVGCSPWGREESDMTE